MRVGLFSLVERWRAEAADNGRAITRIVLAYEAGRDGFWLARCAETRGFEAHVIHASSIAVSRDPRRAKTDRLDTALLMRVLLGWLRGEPGHCSMVVVPELDEEDARRPTRERENLVGERTRLINRMKAALARLGIRGFNPALRKAAGHLADLRTPEGASLPPRSMAELRRDMARLRFIESQIAEIEHERETRLEQALDGTATETTRSLSRVVGIGLETADMLTHEIMLRDLRDRRAVARYAGLTGSPHESGARRRERGLSRAGNARVTSRHGSAGLALSRVPEGECSGEVVQGENRRRARPHSHGVDCRPRAQAPHCIVAHDKDGRGSRRGLRPAARGRIVPDGPPRAVLS